MRRKDGQRRALQATRGREAADKMLVAEAVSRKCGINMSTALEAVDCVHECLRSAIGRGEHITVLGFARWWKATGLYRKYWDPYRQRSRRNPGGVTRWRFRASPAWRRLCSGAGA